MTAMLVALAALAVAGMPDSVAGTAGGEPRPVTHSRVVLDPGVHARVFDARGGEPLGRLGPHTRFGSRTVLAVADRRGPWLAIETALAGNGGHGWIRLDPERMRLGATRWSLHADLSDRALELLRGGRVVERIPTSVGGPRTPTPTGSFGVTDRIGDGISPAYGAGAIALTATQPKLPPGWPGGDQVAIHGGDGAAGRAVSNGCLRVDDTDVIRLSQRVPLGAPVVVEP